MDSFSQITPLTRLVVFGDFWHLTRYRLFFSKKAIFASFGRNWTLLGNCQIQPFFAKNRQIESVDSFGAVDGIWRFCSIAKNRQISPKNARFPSDRPDHRKIVATSRLAVSGGFWRFYSIAKDRQILPKNARFPSDRPERRDGRFITDGHVAVVKRAGPSSFVRAVRVLCYNIINIIISDRNWARSEI